MSTPSDLTRTYVDLALIRRVLAETRGTCRALGAAPEILDDLEGALALAARSHDAVPLDAMEWARAFSEHRELIYGPDEEARRRWLAEAADARRVRTADERDLAEVA